MDILFFVVAFLSSIVGAICGIGGGVVIKPVLDMMQMGAPATINFLSGCTVLSMSLYSVSKALRAGDSRYISLLRLLLHSILPLCHRILSAVHRNRSLLRRADIFHSG